MTPAGPGPHQAAGGSVAIHGYLRFNPDQASQQKIDTANCAENPPSSGLEHGVLIELNILPFACKEKLLCTKPGSPGFDANRQIQKYAFQCREEAGVMVHFG